ncbi:unnamed protein product [Gongylonema pulchrum]|uniref:Helitron_like_N domain-containing protein n=1 Tax=Gongylonema pulchrum TaxID=637853 RepID=A0A183CXG4_9BILA|nr:unnamed protein product [Gongylonema pulchrum]
MFRYVSKLFSSATKDAEGNGKVERTLRIFGTQTLVLQNAFQDWLNYDIGPNGQYYQTSIPMVWFYQEVVKFFIPVA